MTERIDALAAWEEAPFYTEQERAAFAWAESVTLVGEDHVPDTVYQEAVRYFPGKALVDLTIAVIAINNWNRMGISFRTPIK